MEGRGKGMGGGEGKVMGGGEGKGDGWRGGERGWVEGRKCGRKGEEVERGWEGG